MMSNFWRFGCFKAYTLCNVRFFYLKTQDCAKIAGLGGKLKGVGGVVEKKRLPVETDPEKLVKYACGVNIYKEGEDPKLKDDSEYPEWIWNLRLGKKPTLDELDPNTKEYWLLLRNLDRIRTNKLINSREKPEIRLNEHKKQIEKLKEIRFRALAGHYYDPGTYPGERI